MRVAVLIGLGGVAATWWLGRRAYGTGAAIVGAAAVAVATTHVAYSRVAVTDVLLTLAVTCVLVLAVEGRIEWAGLAVGLAASAKYPGVIAAVPVLVAGWGRWRALGKAGALAAAGFLLTSPFVILHAGAAWDDVSRVQRLARAGWLGFENDPIAPLAYLDRLWEAIGPLLILALVGVVVALVRRTRSGSDPALVRRRLLADADASGRALRPLRPAARPCPRRARREHPRRRTARSRCARAAACLEHRRRARADEYRHAPAGRRLGRRRTFRRGTRSQQIHRRCRSPIARWCGSSFPARVGARIPRATLRCYARRE